MPWLKHMGVRATARGSEINFRLEGQQASHLGPHLSVRGLALESEQASRIVCTVDPHAAIGEFGLS
jgi:hypothetical protein